MSELHELDEILSKCTLVTKDIHNDPYNPSGYMRRALHFERLGFPDLSIMDTYKALLLLDEVIDEDGEYHEVAREAIRMEMSHAKQAPDLSDDINTLLLEESSPALSEYEDTKTHAKCIKQSERYKQILLGRMSKYLVQIGCLRDAYDYVRQAFKMDPANFDAKQAWDDILRFSRSNCLTDDNPSNSVDLSKVKLPAAGHVRREIYPWNEHEARRDPAAVLALLNAELQKVAPALQVRMTELPALEESHKFSTESRERTTTTQLGIFAQQDIAPGEDILTERSLLTGNCRPLEPLCDACSTTLPSLDDPSATLVECENCDDIIFCSPTCHDLAQEQYHPAICDTDIDGIAKEVPPEKAADTLYTLLLFRVFAMSRTQNTHPLDLMEVKYIWGDFTPSIDAGTQLDENVFHNSPRTLPFSFQENLVKPLHMLEMMDIDIFAVENDLSELWVWNTLYAKFRGTASARISPRDGRPEVAAVHPLWCLANHSCDPNVQWEWAGEIKFTTRESGVAWERKDEEGNVVATRPERQRGIRKDEEILNHYVDIRLPVKDRREWGAGALGGACMCERCVWESSPAA